MSTTSRTTNFNLPLPVPSNLLADDVVNIRDATITIDSLLNDRVTAADVATSINAAISNLVDGAPATLDTLNEIAAAISDDPNFYQSLVSAADITAAHTTWLTADHNHTLTNAQLKNARLLIDTSVNTVTINLPSSPNTGEYIQFIDASGSFDTNNLTLGRNGLKIMGLDENMTVATKNANFTLVYASASQGWRIA